MFYELAPLAKSLLTEFKAGNENAYAKLYSRFHTPILKYVKTRIRDEEVACELTQEVFIKMFRFREAYQEEYAFSTWLWTIARNTVSDHLRGAQSQRLQLAQEEISAEELPCTLKNAEALLLKKDQRRSFMIAIRSLTRPQKRVIWMRMIHQLSYSEISQKLGVSQTAVKNLAFRARGALLAMVL
jgi:RNA polymerase sigma factor (sigma-70 family)